MKNMQAEHAHTDSGFVPVIISWIMTALAWAATPQGNHLIGSIAGLMAIAYTSMKIYDRFKRRRHAKQIQP